MITSDGTGAVEVDAEETMRTRIYILPPLFFSSLTKELLDLYREVCSNICSGEPDVKIVIPVLDCDTTTGQYLVACAKIIDMKHDKLSIDEALVLAEKLVRTYICATRAREKRDDYQSDLFCVLDNISYIINMLDEKYLIELLEYLEKTIPQTLVVEKIMKEIIPECSDKCVEYKLASQYGTECIRPIELLKRLIGEYTRGKPVLVLNKVFSYIFARAGINSRTVIWDGRSSKDLSKL